MSAAEEVAQAVKAGVERLIDGRMDKAEFAEFIKSSNDKLDKVKLDKERSAAFWERYNATCYY